MRPIPSPLADLCGVPHELTASGLIEEISRRQISALDGLLDLEINQQAALTRLNSINNYKIQIFEPIKPIIESKFCKVNFQSTTLPILIASFQVPQSSDDEYRSLPTELEQLIFCCLLDSDLRIFEKSKETINGLIIDWRGYFQGKVIVAAPVELLSSELAISYVHSMFGLRTSQNSRIDAPYFSTASASEVLVDVLPSTVSNSNVNLIFEAAIETSPKWRIFSLYRILENAYLNNIKNTLIQQFDLRPKSALKDATNQLGSELNQLITLAESADLRNECIQWDNIFEDLLIARNSYADALDREARDDAPIYGSPPEKRYKKALLRLYKLRCSIAHAGTSSVIYEAHSDSAIAASALIPITEQIVYKLLKLQVTQ